MGPGHIGWRLGIKARFNHDRCFLIHCPYRFCHTLIEQKQVTGCALIFFIPCREPVRFARNSLLFNTCFQFRAWLIQEIIGNNTGIILKFICQVNPETDSLVLRSIHPMISSDENNHDNKCI
jgi:hypothetical protein